MLATSCHSRNAYNNRLYESVMRSAAKHAGEIQKTDNLWSDLSRMIFGFLKHFRVKIIFGIFIKTVPVSSKTKRLYFYERVTLLTAKCLISLK